MLIRGTRFTKCMTEFGFCRNFGIFRGSGETSKPDEQTKIKMIEKKKRSWKTRFTKKNESCSASISGKEIEDVSKWLEKETKDADFVVVVTYRGL